MNEQIADHRHHRAVIEWDQTVDVAKRAFLDIEQEGMRQAKVETEGISTRKDAISMEKEGISMEEGMPMATVAVESISHCEKSLCFLLATGPIQSRGQERVSECHDALFHPSSY